MASIIIKGGDKVLKRLTAIEKDFWMEAVLTKMGVRGSEVLRSKAKKINTLGGLVGSVNYKKEKTAVHIKADAKYADIAMETGRGPGKMPPIAPLKLWAARKTGNPNMAYAIAKKIAIGGTKKWRTGGPKLRTEAIKEIKRKVYKEAKNKIKEVI